MPHFSCVVFMSFSRKRYKGPRGRIEYHRNVQCVLSIVIIIALLLPLVSVQAQITCGYRGSYMVLVSSGKWYGLTGADNTLNGLTLQNATRQISVTGWVWSEYTSSPGYVQGSNFLGNIYAETYTINGASYTVSQSTVTVTTTMFSRQGTQTLTLGQSSIGQVVTTTYTGYYGLMTHQLPGQIITVNGLLVWGPPTCMSPANGMIATGHSVNTYFGLMTQVLIGLVLVAALAYLFMKSNRIHV